MPDTYSQCPKCNFKPPALLPVNESCPACGIYPFKWGQPPRAAATAEADDERYSEVAGSRLASLLQPMDQMSPSTFYGRCFALFLLVIWSFYLVAYDYRYAEINGSFMHNILLPIHEAGHVLFMPFGEFMTMLGGSLFQLAIPLGISIAFVVKNHDNYGAAIGAWWASVSLVDLSPYIYDALHPQMMLIGGHTGEDGGHDWIYLLGAFGQIRNAQYWGAFVHGLGSVFVFAALSWAAIMLWRQREKLTSEF
ncbi:MAG: hypothetical protein PHQ60_06855 [Sideroxydans sp.]|nr:hypothetical protein [Sideroxydans sp.]